MYKTFSLHLLNLPNLLNLHKTHQTCFSQVWRVLAKWFGKCRQVWWVLPKRFGECQWVWRVLANRFGKCRRVWRVSHVSKKGHFGKYSNLLNLRASGHCLVFYLISFVQKSSQPINQIKIWSNCLPHLALGSWMAKFFEIGEE